MILICTLIRTHKCYHNIQDCDIAMRIFSLVLSSIPSNFTVIHSKGDVISWQLLLCNQCILAKLSSITEILLYAHAYIFIICIIFIHVATYNIYIYIYIYICNQVRAGLWPANLNYKNDIVFVQTSVCIHACVCVSMFVCPRPYSVLIIRGMILTLYDWLNKFYSLYMAAVVGIVSRPGLSIEVHHRNQPYRILRVSQYCTCHQWRSQPCSDARAQLFL